MLKRSYNVVMVPIEGQFDFPIAYNLIATFLFAITGVILAIKRDYDLIGVGIMALIVGAGGGLVRDSIFLQDGPPLIVEDSRFLIAIFLAIAVGTVAFHFVRKFDGLFFVADALGLGIYGVIGAQMSLNAGLSVSAAIIVGLSSAIGGGIIRDVLIKREPVVFFPGQFYALAALAGVVTFLLLATKGGLNANFAGIIGITVTFVFRLASIKFDLNSAPLAKFANVNKRKFNSVLDIFTRKRKHK